MFSNDGGLLATKPLNIAYVDVFGYMRDIVYLDDSMSLENNLKIHLSG